MSELTVNRTIWRLLAERVAASPDALAIVDENRRRITFGELRTAAEGVAAGLFARGVRPGQVVSWQLPTTIDAIILALALCRLAAVQNPLVMMLREREVGFICGQAGSDWLVTGTDFRGFDHAAMANTIAAGRRGLRLITIDGALPGDDPAILPDLADDVADVDSAGSLRWIFYTSGTTSDPKGAKHTDRGLIAASGTFCEHLELTAEDRTAVLLPIAHIGGVLHVISALRTGSGLITSATLDPATTPDLLAEQGVSLVGSGVPFLRVFLDRQRAHPDTPLFPRARIALCGGAGRPAALHEQVKRELGGIGVASGYGMTECPFVSWGGVHDTDEEHANTEGRVGVGVDLIVVRPDGSRAGLGESGEIRVQGPQLMLGYVDSRLDVEAFDADGYFRSGDLGFLDERGRLTVTGRLKDVIIRKMENISARELEELLITHEAVADVAVIGLPDPETGERACAVVVPTDPANPPTLAELCEHLLAHRLSQRKLPEHLKLVDELPRNAMGKLVKRELVRRFSPSTEEKS